MRKVRALLALILSVCLLCGMGCARADTDEQVLEGILACFEQLAAIPRPSHHEEKIGAFLVGWAKQRGFEVQQDEVGNVIFDVPATVGFENSPVVALQAHMDMVAVSEDPDFDPLNTPIKTIRGENTLTADGTSLGADDGIGVATIMYYVDSSSPHGPLRAIFTVNEENGMTGIHNLDASVVSDVDYLLNLDAETLGEAIVSTAAGIVLTATQTPRRVEPKLDTAVAIELGGLKGGHSGVMINAGLINAIQAMGDILLYIKAEGVDYELSSFVGGAADNAIPDSATAIITLPGEDVSKVNDIAASRVKALAGAYRLSDPDVNVDIQTTDMPQTVFAADQADNIVDFAAIVFNGVHTMSQSIKDLVESSSNIGVIHADADQVTAELYARSSQQALLDSINIEQVRLAHICGFETSLVYSADAWPVDLDSKLHPLMQEVYYELTGKELKLVSMHAGLECGTFARLKEGLDMISIGPELHDVHSTNETLFLDSIVPFYRLVEQGLIRLAQEG